MTAPPAAPPDGSDHSIVPLVVARGAAVGLLLAVPAAYANKLFGAQEPKSGLAVNLSALVVVLGFGLAGAFAGNEARHREARHGFAAALVAFVPVEVIAILGRLDRGDGVSLPSIVILGFLAALAGNTGGAFAARRHHRTPGGIP